MSKNHVRLGNPSIAIALFGAAIVLSPASGYGQPGRLKDRRLCANAYEKAQELRQVSKLRRSREALLGCAKSSCGEFVQTECKRWLTEIDSEGSYCLTGALLKAAGDDDALYRRALRSVGERLGMPACAMGGYGCHCAVIGWNDQIGRTRHEVVAKLEEIIRAELLAGAAG